MKHTFLIARQEFIKYVTRRGFLISVLMFPLWIMVVIFVPQWTGGGSGTAAHRHDFAILDKTGGAYRDAILASLARGQGSANWRYVFTPRDVRDADAAHFPQAAHAALTGPLLDAIVVIPADFATNPHHDVQFWSEDTSDTDFKHFFSESLTDALRLKAVQRVAPQVRDTAIFDVTAFVQSRKPSKGNEAVSMIDSVVPIALAIILFVVSVMNSSVLLQGVVEEKSTRMIEVLLSCATPREITSGKLIGVIAVALATLFIWALVLFGLMTLASHDTAALVVTSLGAIASLHTLPFLLLFFLCGLLIYGSLFLAIGSMAASLADAQSLLGPSMLILMLPNLMINAVVRDPNGTLASALTWIPFYTPFFMMLRISSNPPAWQVWGAVVVVIATTILMILWTGRIFARHVLTTERPPSLGNLVRGLLGRAS
ncbi:MAG TPA: ABC transporter permease [Rhizomicrobium sp.]|jgi:ABC-2 type transport system permease protein|nr:ABC transporter permease [Rhizomicrobium sp.]